MPSFFDQLKKAQAKVADESQAVQTEQPATPAAPAAPQRPAPGPVVGIPDAAVKQKYSIYLTDAQREFMENYWHANRHKKQTPGKPKKKINYSDIIAEALELLAEKNGFTI